MNLHHLDILRYCERHTQPEDPRLQEISRVTHQRSPYPQMLSGHIQGRFLGAVSRMLRPARILEIGAFTGYGTLCLAEGLAEDGRIDTIENNPELEDILQANLSDALPPGSYRLIMGDASEVLRELQEPYDLVFIDADKVNYPLYLRELKRLTRKGSWILADNVLWGGKVISGESTDPDTKGILEFNRLVTEDTGLRSVMLPLRDGLSLTEVV